MNRNHGFTLIELLVTMTIVVILLTLGVANLRSSQVTARDDQRVSDVTVIAQQLENYYKAGSDTQAAGEYPSTDLVSTEANVKLALRDIDTLALRAPNVLDSETMSFTVATSVSVPSPNVDTYVYQPIQSNGALCNATAQECRKFNLFYKLESNAAVQKITSRNQ